MFLRLPRKYRPRSVTTAVVMLVMVGLWFVSLGMALVSDTNESPIVEHAVLPSATDKLIDKFSGDGWAHRAYRKPAVVEKHQLVVYLPGTGGKGPNAKDFCRLAANQGFHVVSLAYPSNISMSVFHNSQDTNAFLKARENIIYGKVPYGILSTNEPNSIHNRLLKLVGYLAKTYPKENWNQFLDPQGALEWRKLVLSGGSQGGGHAALLVLLR